MPLQHHRFPFADTAPQPGDSRLLVTGTSGAGAVRHLEGCMNEENNSGLLQDVRDLEPAVLAMAADGTDGGSAGSMSVPDHKRGGDSDGTDTQDSDGTDAGDSDGTDAGGDSDGTDAGDSDGTDNA
jgi:hypothetical protein